MKAALCRYLIAIDPSLTCSGWAIFCLARCEPIRFGVLRPPGPTSALPLRLSQLQKEVTDLFEELSLGEKDLLVSEGPAPLVHNPQSALKVERVRSIFEAVARARGMIVPGRVNPRTLQREVLGMVGRQLSRDIVKECARTIAVQLFGEKLSIPVKDNDVDVPTSRSNKQSEKLPQDIIDALLIGWFAANRVKVAAGCGQEVQEVLLSGAQSNRRSKNSSQRNQRWTENDIRRVNNRR
jgi:hypothetical protein